MEVLGVAPLIIGAYVWLGSEFTIISGVPIRAGAVIQPNAIIVDDTPKGANAGGHPPEVSKYRDLEHYEGLKAEGKFKK